MVTYHHAIIWEFPDQRLCDTESFFVHIIFMIGIEHYSAKSGLLVIQLFGNDDITVFYPQAKISQKSISSATPFGWFERVRQDISTIPGVAILTKGGQTGDAPRKIIPALLNILVASAKDHELRLPAEVDGFIRVSPEIVD